LSSSPKIYALVGLGQTLGVDSDIAAVPQEFSLRDRRKVQRAFWISEPGSDAEDIDLVSQIDRLHGIAKTAIRSHQADEWRDIGKLYELILLALPREALRVGLPFEGAIAAPGIFGLGPLQRIERNLYRELELALEVDDAELTDAVSYLPLAIAQRAARLEANAIVAAMLGLYPSMYALARSSSQ
jgi:hypothetical protein